MKLYNVIKGYEDEAPQVITRFLNKAEAEKAAAKYRTLDTLAWVTVEEEEI